MRQDKKKRARNLKVDTELKNLSKKFIMALNSKKEDAKKLGMKFISKLDKAGSKGILHKNTVSRKKSRILSKLAKLG